MAIWSAFCYIMGLGDRHCGNILIKLDKGAIIHVDFDCIFDKGKNLPTPEIVPIRLTRNFEDAMGSFKSFGLFKYYLC